MRRLVLALVAVAVVASITALVVGDAMQLSVAEIAAWVVSR